MKRAGKTVWLGGNIGTPLLSHLDEIQPSHLAMVELSSFQLMDMKHSPHLAVVTNLSPNHLDVHKDMEEYVWAKENIFRFQNQEDVLILNADNAITAGFAGNGVTKFFSRWEKQNVYEKNGTIYRNGQPLMAKSDILLPGEHNVENYMAAILAVEGLVEDAVIRQVAKNFGGGAGAGVNVIPVAVLSVKDGNVKLLPVAPPAHDAVGRAVEMVPEMFDKVTGYIDKKTAEKAPAEDIAL